MLSLDSCKASDFSQTPSWKIGATVRISCAGSIAQHGTSDYERMLQLLRLDSGAAAAQALLNALPQSNWLRRPPRLIMNDTRLSSGLTVAHFLCELCSVGYLDVRGLGNMSDARRRMWRALPRQSRLRDLARPLPWAAIAQLVELWSGEEQVHVAVARVSLSGCDAGLLEQLDGIRNALGDMLDDVLAASHHRSGGTRRTTAIGNAIPAAATEAAAEAADNAADTQAVQEVSQQYETLPFPPRKAADERTRTKPIHSTLASLVEISHFAFGGRFQQRFCACSGRPFRALVAGGGTGDATVQLAHELAELHKRWPSCGYNRSQLVHLDLSTASVQLATERLRAGGLLHSAHGGDGSGPAVRLVAASLLSLPELRLGTFDYINLCGVLHHLPDPPKALAMIQRHALAEAGSIGLMVYGTLGRRGVYETQAMLRLLHAAGNVTSEQGSRLAGSRAATQPSAARPWPIRARVADAAELVASLPAASPLRRNTPVWQSDEVRLRMGDAGLFDLLLHSTDQPYTRPRLVALARRAGMRVGGWLHAGLYHPRYWLRPCSGAFGPCDTERDDTQGQPSDPYSDLRQRLAALDEEAAAEFAELASGHVRKHWAYLMRDDDRQGPGRHADIMHADAAAADAAAEPALATAAGAATGMEADLAPCALNVSRGTLAALAAREAKAFSVQTLLQGEAMVTRMPPLTSALLSRIDCKTPLATLLDAMLLQLAPESKPEERLHDAWAQWVQLHDQLSAVGGWLFMTDLHLPPALALQDIAGTEWDRRKPTQSPAVYRSAR